MMREQRIHNEQLFSLQYWQAQQRDQCERERIQLIERTLDRAHSSFERQVGQHMHIDRERAVDESVARHVDMYSNMYNTQHNTTLRAAETFGPQHPLYPELSNRVRDLKINQTLLNFREMESNMRACMQPLQQLDQFGQVLPPAPSRQPPPLIVPPPTLSLRPYTSLSMASSSYSPSRTEAGPSNFPGNYGAEPEDSQMEERATGPAVNTEGVIGNDPGNDTDEGSLYDG